MVEVRDSGIGLDPDRAERVFEAFYTTKTEGIGIGLSISRSIVEAHGGRLWAAPNEPHGAVFRFSLPVAQEGAVMSEGQAVVFVIDDDEASPPRNTQSAPGGWLCHRCVQRRRKLPRVRRRARATACLVADMKMPGTSGLD